mgnify:CR=1 FL=1
MAKKTDDTNSTALSKVRRAANLKALPAPKDCWEDPDVFSKYIFSHTEQIMSELFLSINELSPAERVKALQPLLNTILAFRPYVNTATTNNKNIHSEVEDKISEFLKRDYSSVVRQKQEEKQQNKE